jgi:hypothetical protein
MMHCHSLVSRDWLDPMRPISNVNGGHVKQTARDLHKADNAGERPWLVIQELIDASRKAVGLFGQAFCAESVRTKLKHFWVAHELER